MITAEIIGQIVGFVALAFFVVSYQMRTKTWLLVVQSVGTLLICIQYLLIGAYTGFALNLVCLLRNGLYYVNDKKSFGGWWLPAALALLMAGMGALSWEGAHSLLILTGLMINTVCMGICKPQGLRASVILTSTLILIYNVIVFSLGGILNEGLSVLSAALGLIRFYRVRRASEQQKTPPTV